VGWVYDNRIKEAVMPWYKKQLKLLLVIFIGTFIMVFSVSGCTVKSNNYQNLTKKEVLQRGNPGCEIDIDSAGVAMIVKPDGTYFFLSAEEVNRKWKQQ
jgi:hypothetical protein